MTDVTRPDVVWIEGRCYRVNDAATEVTALQEHDLYENDVNYNQEYEDGEDDDFEVTMIDPNRYSTSFHVSKHYIGAIIGKKGAMKARISRDTRTEIKIPRQGQEGDIVIFGPSALSVKAARRRINIIIKSSRMRQSATHFVSIPMNKPEIMEKYNNFKASVLKECEENGVHESIFIAAERLHLTIVVMALMDNEERIQASKLLTEAKEKIIMPLLNNHLPLKIRLKGLSYMNDDPKEIHVLYGLVEEEDKSGVLQNLADSISECFSRAGFMKDDYDRNTVKLHVTLMNSKYRNRSTEDNKVGSRQKSKSFDGSGVLQKFADYDFGSMELTEIHLSQRHSKRSDGYYQPTCIISI